MAYMDLRKLFFIDEERYRKTFSDRFYSENAIRLDFDIAGNQAFFVQCDEVIRQVYSILTLDKEIALLCKKLPGVAGKQYSRRCLIDEIVITNNIEGVHSSRKEIGEALSILEERSTAKGKKNLFIGLVNKYHKLLSREQVPLKTCEDVRNIYDELVLPEVVSEDKRNAPDGKIFRKSMTEIYSATGRSIHRGKYPESEIVAYMEKALAFLNDESILPLYRICLFHYMIEFIHPFYDGNGRLGRFILSYCISEYLERLVAYRISETIKENIKMYYDAFSLCNDHRDLADLTPFLLMMLEMIGSAMKDLKESLTNKLTQWGRYEKIIGQLEQHQNDEMSALYNILIQAALFSEQGISTQELLAVFRVNYATIRKRLSIVRDQELLVEVKSGNKKYYSIYLQGLDEMIMVQ